jgi:hypothetical protein
LFKDLVFGQNIRPPALIFHLRIGIPGYGLFNGEPCSLGDNAGFPAAEKERNPLRLAGPTISPREAREELRRRNEIQVAAARMVALSGTRHNITTTIPAIQWISVQFVLVFRGIGVVLG